MQNDLPNDSRETDSSARTAVSGLAAFWAELRRRTVVRVAIAYAAAWAIMQVANTTFEGFGIPKWAFRFATP